MKEIDLKMDEETRIKLASILPITELKEAWFTPKICHGMNDAPRFKIRPLTNSEIAEYHDKLYHVDEVETSDGIVVRPIKNKSQIAVKMCKKIILGWENYPLEESQQDRVPVSLCEEIYTYALGLSLIPDELKTGLE